MGQSASSVLIAGATGQDAGAKSSRIISLLSSPSGGGKLSAAVQDAPQQKGGKMKTLFEKFKGAKFMSKLGNVMGKLQLKAPIHLIDSMITYAIGVVSGMQDMAQVDLNCFIHSSHSMGPPSSLSLPPSDAWLCMHCKLLTLIPSGTKNPLCIGSMLSLVFNRIRMY